MCTEYKKNIHHTFPTLANIEETFKVAISNIILLQVFQFLYNQFLFKFVLLFYK